jgi:hypothetical protein
VKFGEVDGFRPLFFHVSNERNSRHLAVVEENGDGCSAGAEFVEGLSSLGVLTVIRSDEFVRFFSVLSPHRVAQRYGCFAGFGYRRDRAAASPVHYARSRTGWAGRAGRARRIVWRHHWEGYVEDGNARAVSKRQCDGLGACSARQGQAGSRGPLKNLGEGGGVADAWTLPGDCAARW